MDTHRIASWVDWLIQMIRRQELLVLLVSLLIIAGTWVFVELADEVLEGDSQGFDNWLLRSLRRGEDPSRPIGPDWLTGAALNITALGSVWTLAIVTAVVAGYLWLKGKHRAMWLVLAATITGELLSAALKKFFDRPRPAEVLHLAEVSTASFPSGHSMLSAVVYLTLGAMLAGIEPQKRVRAFILVVSLAMALLIGVSRIYLGVHYPTDVLAGWSAGLTWALLCWLVARRLKARGALQK